MATIDRHATKTNDLQILASVECVNTLVWVMQHAGICPFFNVRVSENVFCELQILCSALPYGFK